MIIFLKFVRVGKGDIHYFETEKDINIRPLLFDNKMRKSDNVIPCDGKDIIII